LTYNNYRYRDMGQSSKGDLNLPQDKTGENVGYCICTASITEHQESKGFTVRQTKFEH